MKKYHIFSMDGPTYNLGCDAREAKQIILGLIEEGWNKESIYVIYGEMCEVKITPAVEAKVLIDGE